VTDLVADWVNGTYPNQGMEIIGDERIQNRERAFYSRETGTALYPQLVVNYTHSNDAQPPDVSVDPLPPYVTRNFVVSWSGTDNGPAGIDNYDVQYRIDSGAWVNWRTHVTYTSDEFVGGQHGHLYEFRARATDRAGNVEPFGAAEAQTTVDNRAPNSEINPLPSMIGVPFIDVSWSGTDEGSGIQYYDVRYRFDGGSWLLWLPQTIATSATLNNALDGVYEFEVRAVDQVGLQEPFQGQAEAAVAVDAEPPYIAPVAYLPLMCEDAIVFVGGVDRLD
jgi:hypothetical protein